MPSLCPTCPLCTRRMQQCCVATCGHPHQHRQTAEHTPTQAQASFCSCFGHPRVFVFALRLGLWVPCAPLGSSCVVCILCALRAFPPTLITPLPHDRLCVGFVAPPLAEQPSDPWRQCRGAPPSTGLCTAAATRLVTGCPPGETSSSLVEGWDGARGGGENNQRGHTHKQGTKRR